MHPRNRTLLAWSLWLGTVGCLLGGLLVTLAEVRPLTSEVLVDGAFEGSSWLLFATIGLVLTLRRPGNPIGWLYAAAGLVWSLNVPWDPWIDQLLRDGHPLPALARYTALIGENFWAIGIVLAITLPLLLLPDGRLRSHRWRVVAVAAVAGTAMTVVGWCLDPAPMSQTLEPVAKPFALGGSAGAVASVVTWTGLAILFASVPAAALCVVLRFRASRGVERQQLRWVAYGAIVSVAGPLLAIALEATGISPTVDAFSWPLLLSVPLAIAVAVLRYRLWDLDRLVSRTVAYLLLTGLLLVPYLLVVSATSRLVAGSGSLAVAAATLAAVAAFAPLRRRVQQVVDRRFNRRRYDAARTVDAFSVRLRDQVDLDALHVELLGVVDQTMQPTQAHLWLRPQGQPRPAR